MKKFTVRKYKLYRKNADKRLKKHPHLIPVTGILAGFFVMMNVVIFTGGETIGATDAKVVNLSIDGNTQVIPTRAKSVGELMEKLNLDLIPEDEIEPAKHTPIEEDNFNIAVHRARPVTVIDGEKQSTALTAAKAPRQVAEKAGVTLYPEDKAEFMAGTSGERILGEKMVIDRAQLVRLNLYGTPIETRTHSTTVADLLKEKNVQPLPDDTIQPSLQTPITSELQVFIIRFGKQVVTVEEAIAPPVVFVSDASLVRGATSVKEKGIPGKRVVTYEIETQNGKESARRVIQSVNISEPVRELRAKGTRVDTVTPQYVGDKSGVMAAAGISSGDFGYVDYIISRESGWRTNARNAGGCLGLGQACPGSKISNACPDLNAVCQLQWFSGYANGRYGGWGGAYNFWIAHHWW